MGRSKWGVAAVAVAALLATAVQPAGARTADTKSWCNAVIQTNTKAGTMKNKRFLDFATVPASAWKNVVDAAAAHGDEFIALAPSSIKTAVKHQIAYFKHIKANHYSKTTPLAPMTLADVKKITDFERTQCGIKF
jgi:hypothetical protein